ncbi:DCL family protein [Pararhizobium sp. IMCC21322]|uniref:DCL family protein n=1 Tax=Pararhizobium sp. IMCC21322 TaxID=3067903 RepID=UPI0027414117|nr:DCL family protein [Pararhizobium sp. IMCC21322]
MARAQPVEIGDMKFAKKGDALNYLKSLLNRYSPEERVSAVDEIFLLKALKNHPEVSEKVGAGVAHIFVRRADYGTKCFWVRRTDGSEERFSYKSCV